MFATTHLTQVWRSSVSANLRLRYTMLESQCSVSSFHNLLLSRERSVSNRNLVETESLSALIVCPGSHHVFGRSADVPSFAFAARKIGARSTLAECLSLTGDVLSIDVRHWAHRDIEHAGICASGVNFVDGVNGCSEKTMLANVAFSPWRHAGSGPTTIKGNLLSQCQATKSPGLIFGMCTIVCSNSRCGCNSSVSSWP